MNRRRITIAAVALVAAVVAVLAVACWGTVRDHVQAWHFQLTRETKTIAPLVDGGALDPFLRREPLLRIAFQELHHPVIFDPPEASQLPRMGNWYQVSLDGEEAARVLLERCGYRVLVQRFPERAYVLIRSGDSLLPGYGLFDPPVNFWDRHNNRRVKH